MHILEEFKSSADGGPASKLDAELIAGKECYKKREERFVEVENQATELTKANSTLLSQVILFALTFYFTFFSLLSL